MPEPISVILVTNYRPDKQYSMLRFSKLLKEHLISDQINIKEIFPKPVWNRANFPKKTRKWLGYADKYLVFPKQVRKALHPSEETQKPTIMHVADHSNSVYFPKKKGIPTMLTCHDLIAIRSALDHFTQAPHVSATGKLLQSNIRKSIPQADRIACDSQSTEKDLHSLLPKTQGKTRVIHLGLADKKTLSQPEKNTLPFNPRTTSYLLHVGNAAWYKNRKTVLDAFRLHVQHNGHSELHLILVGPSPTPEELSPETRQWLAINENRVLSLPDISENTLQLLYRHAIALLFPSLIEGFGWPPLEAQALGCPVIASQTTSLAEILNDGCFPIPPEDPEAIDRAITLVIKNGENVREVVTNGMRNAISFSFRKTAAAYSKEYQELAYRLPPKP